MELRYNGVGAEVSKGKNLYYYTVILPECSNATTATTTTKIRLTTTTSTTTITTTSTTTATTIQLQVQLQQQNTEYTTGEWIIGFGLFG